MTPLHDGMNLVAKEYVAAQNPFDPGVLVLSEFAGAANELDAALLVNPHDIDGMARTLATALAMPLNERRVRWEAMMAKLRRSSIQSWFSDFVEALQAAHDVNQQAAEPDGTGCCLRCACQPGRTVAPGDLAIWPLRSVNGREGAGFGRRAAALRAGIGARATPSGQPLDAGTATGCCAHLERCGGMTSLLLGAVPQYRLSTPRRPCPRMATLSMYPCRFGQTSAGPSWTAAVRRRMPERPPDPICPRPALRRIGAKHRINSTAWINSLARLRGPCQTSRTPS